jgi:hypothetical protein
VANFYVQWNFEIPNNIAKIEDLIAQIPDERLKKAIGAEVREEQEIWTRA